MMRFRGQLSFKKEENNNVVHKVYLMMTHNPNDLNELDLSYLRNKYQGQRCFIVGNGPSLNSTNLDILEKEYVWAANKFYLLFDQIRWRPSFYVSMDHRLTQDMAGEITQVIEENPSCLFFFPTIFRENKTLKNGLNVYWFNERKWDLDQEFSEWTFSTDPSKWVAHPATVTITCLQIAAYMGFDPIYLIGCDTTYTAQNSVIREDSDEHLISTLNNDPNHFSPNYLGAGVKWTAPNPEMMIYQYNRSKPILDHLGVAVLNATVGGNLEVFPRVRLEDVIYEHEI
jgi:hypothetical protein